ncbi:MAG: tripartite tricarboxylate transporter substrate binding protein [Betaproteobacteria bacterium]|nr:tripartite tricarboxylate transporter substrate binding protein [Betaproteobacteria bacterium]
MPRPLLGHLRGLATASLLNCVVATAIILFSVSASAAEWKPDKSIEMIIPTGTGGGQDSMGRAIHAIIQTRKLVEVPVAVVNKPGGGQAVGYNYLNQKAGDAHYVAFSTVNLLTNQITGANPLSHTDVTPIAMLVHEYLLFVVRSDSPVKDAQGLLDDLRRDPQSRSIGFAPGPGGSAHISLGLVTKAAGIDARRLKVVVFKSGGEATTAVLGGHVDVAVAGIAPVTGHLRAGKMRAIAVPAPKRLSGELGNVPTWRELGVNAIFANWRGVIGPRAITSEQVAYWERVFREVAKTDEWKSRLRKFSQEDGYTDAAGAREFLRAEYEVLRSVLTELGFAK